jgi:hypothetical protein
MDIWVRDCWNSSKNCADLNGDGLIDENDLTEKQKQVSQKLAEWMEACGFNKKGGIKR